MLPDYKKFDTEIKTNDREWERKKESRIASSAAHIHWFVLFDVLPTMYVHTNFRLYSNIENKRVMLDP